MRLHKFSLNEIKITAVLPLKEGLKLYWIRLEIEENPHYSGTSIKRRIETQTGFGRVGLNKRITAVLPLKEGLKQSGETVPDSRIIITAVLPLKEGLKRLHSGFSLTSGLITAVLPLKEGLKHQHPGTETETISITAVLPLKEGLKPLLRH